MPAGFHGSTGPVRVIPHKRPDHILLTNGFFFIFIFSNFFFFFFFFAWRLPIQGLIYYYCTGLAGRFEPSECRHVSISCYLVDLMMATNLLLDNLLYMVL